MNGQEEWEVVKIETVPMTPEQYEQTIQALSNLILTYYTKTQAARPRRKQGQSRSQDDRGKPATPGTNPTGRAP